MAVSTGKWIPSHRNEFVSDIFCLLGLLTLSLLPSQQIFNTPPYLLIHTRVNTWENVFLLSKMEQDLWLKKENSLPRDEMEKIGGYFCCTDMVNS